MPDIPQVKDGRLRMVLQPVPEIYPLSTIQRDHLSDACSYRQLQEWAGRLDHFPKPKRSLGIYNLYDVDEVVEWVTLWKRVTANMGRGNALNERNPT